MSDNERPRRKHGLSPPYTIAQVSTWITLPTLVLEFLFFVSPILPLAASIPCTLVVVGLAAMSAYYGLLAMYIDPSDPRLFVANANASTGATSTYGAECTIDPNESTKHCWICDVTVAEQSMHCKFCNKCVHHFDHHCMCKLYSTIQCRTFYKEREKRCAIWIGLAFLTFPFLSIHPYCTVGLNTCVGKANYPYFYRTMVSITALLIAHSAIQLALVLDIFLGPSGEERADDWFQADAKLAVVIVLCVFLVFDVLALSLIGQLLHFHRRLQREGLTTYRFIVQENQKRREENKLNAELLSRRIVAVAKAREEGRSMDVCRLRVGGYLRVKCGMKCCDPLSVEEEAKQEQHHNGNNGVADNGAIHVHMNGKQEVTEDSHADEESKEPEESP